MNATASIGLRLTAICASAALVLGLANAAAAPLIAANRQAELKAVLSAMGGAAGLEERVRNNQYVRTWQAVKDARGRPAGYVMRLTGTGHGGDMQLLAGFSPAGEIMGAKLLDSAETPGLGKMAEKPEYFKKFMGSGAVRPVPTRKSQLARADADSVSGATLTFSGIGKALEAGSGLAKTLGGKK
jgi:electron transport complex protein RnfG